MTTENAAERLGRLVRARRKRLQLHTAADFAQAAQVSTRLIGDLETGRRSNFSAANKASIEDTLNWEYGSIDDALAGGDPRERESLSTQATAGESPSTEEELINRLQDNLTTTRQYFSEMLVNYIGMGQDLADFIEFADDALLDETRKDLAHRLRQATRSVAAQFLVQLDPSWDLPDLIEQATALLTDEDRRTTEEARQNFIAASAAVDRRRRLQASNVTSLADRRKVPPPPSLDEIDVAASRREKQSDRDPSPGWWISPEEVAHLQTTPGSVPDSIRAVVPKAVFREYAASVEGARKHLKAVEDAVAQGKLTTDIVTSLLNAIAAYATAARDFTSELRRVELDATPDQIDAALPLFEQARRFAASLSRFVGHLLPAATNTDESDRLIATQRSLAELEDFHRDAYDIWIETGRSSKSLKAVTSRREKQSDRDRDDEDGK
ncbi:helix-turn-helix domain-containing protein [Mycobacteroides chelonae]|uniref:helix-turn-helix domain-containing protein n=1 Tax=Mycobacteroides chelonae TaxID=1774 RepID=UPI00095E369D|nr:helix-turn-helix transcriptional regulator [Mycobacteroides chelonae]OLT80548.1 hypothetical protein BKG57_11130 [Mycobacteroides chelonae]